MNDKAGLTATAEDRSETLDALWRQFRKAATEKEYCSAWLALQCTAIPGVASGVVLLGSDDDGQPFTLAASWPEGPGDFKHLGDVAERSLRERRGLVLKRQSDAPDPRTRYDIAYPINVSGKTFGVVAMDIDHRPEEELREVMRELQWGSSWMEVLALRGLTSKDTAPQERLQAVMTLLTSVVTQKSFHGAAVAMATAMATRFDCDRVSIGLLRRGSIRLEAMSHTGQFGGDTNLVRAIDAAMNEAVDQDSPVVFPEAAHRRAVANRANAKLSKDSGNASICSIPLPGRERIVGAITLERTSGEGFDDEVITVCESLAGLAGPILETHRRDDRWLIRKFFDSSLATLKMLIGPSHVAAKLGVVALIAVAVFLSYAEATYRVTSDTVLEPATQQAIATAFDGYIRTATKRAGDEVRQGEVIATLDDREWQLERDRWQSQADQSQRQFQEALGNGNASQAQIFSAQISQSKAQVALLSEQIARTRITAPFDGIIVTGDFSQALGAPIQRGQILFQMAPLDSYRVILQVDERDIANVITGQRGQLVLAGSPNDPLPFEVRRITPVSVSTEGRNYFRVEADLDGAPGRLRPGMEGVGKIEVDQRLLVWIWTHEAIDWMRMKIWNWLP